MRGVVFFFLASTSLLLAQEGKPTDRDESGFVFFDDFNLNAVPDTSGLDVHAETYASCLPFVFTDQSGLYTVSRDSGVAIVATTRAHGGGIPGVVDPHYHTVVLFTKFRGVHRVHAGLCPECFYVLEVLNPHQGIAQWILISVCQNSYGPCIRPGHAVYWFWGDRYHLVGYARKSKPTAPFNVTAN